MIIWKRKDINVGEQNVSELTILEWKKFFSFKYFRFHPSKGCQDRFHTHAFNAWSFLIKGDYTEEMVIDGQVHALKRSRSRLIYIPANEYTGSPEARDAPHSCSQGLGLHTGRSLGR